MARKKTLEDSYEGIPLSAFEGVMDAARPLIPLLDKTYDQSERINELKRTLHGPGKRCNIDRKQVSQEIRDLNLQIEAHIPHVNELIDAFCQACLDFRYLNL